MWLDERTEFADNVSVAAAASTALIGHVIDMQVARDLGNGQPVYLCIRTGSTEIITGDSAANASQMNAGGTIYFGALPLESFAYEQFLGVLCTVATTTVTAGTINAFLTIDPNGWKSYADGAN